MGGADDGVDAVAAHDPDITTLDLHMPGIDGLETLARLRELPDPPSVVYVTGSEEQRVAVAALRALGAGNRLLSRVQAAELLGLGALSGTLAGIASLAVGWALADRVFDFPWQAPLWWPLVGAAVGAVLAWAVGWWGLRDVLRRPAGQSLREAV